MKICRSLIHNLNGRVDLVRDEQTHWECFVNSANNGTQLQHCFARLAEVTEKDILTIRNLMTLLSEYDQQILYDWIACFRRLELYVKYTEWRWAMFRHCLEQRRNAFNSHMFGLTDYAAQECHSRIMDTLRAWDCTESFQVPGRIITLMDSGFQDCFQHSSSTGFPFLYLTVPLSSFKNVWNLMHLYREYGRILYCGSECQQELEIVVHRMLDQHDRLDSMVSETFLFWLPDLAADILGILNCGPAFVMMLQEELLDVDVSSLDDYNTHPSKVLRMMMGIETLRQICNKKFIRYARQLESTWVSYYGDMIRDTPEEDLLEYGPVIVRGILHSPLKCFNDHSLMELIPFSVQDQNNILDISTAYIDGKSIDPEQCIPRHMFAGIRFAFENRVDGQSIETMSKRFISSFDNMKPVYEALRKDIQTPAPVSSEQWAEFIIYGKPVDTIDEIAKLVNT